MRIYFFHINHNKPCLPPKILHKYCFQVLFGGWKIPREINKIEGVLWECESREYANLGTLL